MKRFLFILMVLLVSWTEVSSAKDACQAMTCLNSQNVAYIRIEDWQRAGHPFAAFIKIDGVWQSMVVGSNGFSAEYTAAPVEALIQALVTIPVTEHGLDQPLGLFLDSRSSDVTPIDFCAQLYTTDGQYFAICGDQNPSDGTMAYSTMDSFAHQSQWFIGSGDSDQSVLSAMHNL